ncbi:MAG: YlzJ-like family protein [Oscillospiraceae bacterium]
MMFQTILDINEVMNSDALQNQKTKYCEKNINGVILQGEKTNSGMKINRIISANPSDFLNKHYMIGKEI